MQIDEQPHSVEVHVDRKRRRAASPRQALLRLDALEQGGAKAAQMLRDDQRRVAGFLEPLVVLVRERSLFVVEGGARGKFIRERRGEIDKALLALGVELVHRALHSQAASSPRKGKPARRSAFTTQKPDPRSPARRLRRPNPSASRTGRKHPEHFGLAEICGIRLTACCRGPLQCTHRPMKREGANAKPAFDGSALSCRRMLFDGNRRDRREEFRRPRRLSSEAAYRKRPRPRPGRSLPLLRPCRRSMGEFRPGAAINSAALGRLMLASCALADPRYLAI